MCRSHLYTYIILIELKFKNNNKYLRSDHFNLRKIMTSFVRLVKIYSTNPKTLRKKHEEERQMKDLC